MSVYIYYWLFALNNVYCRWLLSDIKERSTYRLWIRQSSSCRKNSLWHSSSPSSGVENPSQLSFFTQMLKLMIFVYFLEIQFTFICVALLTIPLISESDCWRVLCLKLPQKITVTIGARNYSFKRREWIVSKQL